MDKKNLTSMMLVGLAVTMFGGQMFLDHQGKDDGTAKGSQLVQYVANENIPDGALLHKEMFTAKAVPAEAFMPNQAVQPSQLEGKEMHGNLLKGEIMTTSRISADSETGYIQVNLPEDNVNGLRDGDFVRVSIQPNNSKQGLKVLFPRLRVYQEQSNLAETAAQPKGKFYILLKEDESFTYYSELNTGKLIVNKWSKVYSGPATTENR